MSALLRILFPDYIDEVDLDVVSDEIELTISKVEEYILD